MANEILSGIMVELHVPDFRPAEEFYTQLGFEVVWKREDQEGYMVMKAGSNILNFYCGNEQVYEHKYFRRYPSSTPRGYGVELVVPVENVHELYAKVKQFESRGELLGQIVEELACKPWGKYDFRMEDPFGFYVRLCEPDDWLTP